MIKGMCSSAMLPMAYAGMLSGQVLRQCCYKNIAVLFCFIHPCAVVVVTTLISINGSLLLLTRLQDRIEG